MKRFLVLAIVALTGTFAVGQNKTYIALGDSIGWGYQPPNSSTRGNGDKGYVKTYADWIGTQQSGIRPRLWNLSIPGETTSSFFNTSEIGGILNSNYSLFFRSSQSNLFRSKVASEQAAGRTITHLTYALGANDLLDLQTSAFLSQTFEQQVVQVEQALGVASGKIYEALTLIRQQCPSARVTIPGYYNPYGAFPGGSQDLISKYAIPRLNSILQAYAKRFQAAFAPTYGPFVGNELSATWIGDDDVHPRDSGYAMIAQAVISAKIVLSGPPRS